MTARPSSTITKTTTDRKNKKEGRSDEIQRKTDGFTKEQRADADRFRKGDRHLPHVGVQMGTRFVAAKESIVHDNYKEKLIKAKDIDSEVTGRSTGHPIRVLRNKMTREYLRMEKEGASLEELEKMTLGALRKAVVEGDVATGSVMAGQIAGLVKSEDSCAEIIEEIMSGAEKLLNRTFK